ncbi:MAG: hypothetical protein ACI8QS_003045 [Planctomycetota bacterium]|jgi:hypothetical protein
MAPLDPPAKPHGPPRIERTPEALSRGWAGSPILAAGLIALLFGLDRLIEPDFGELLWLRWTRSVAQHPIRSWLSIWILLRGLKSLKKFLNAH